MQLSGQIPGPLPTNSVPGCREHLPRLSSRVCPGQDPWMHILSAEPLLKSAPATRAVHPCCTSAPRSLKHPLLSKHATPAFAWAHARLRNQSEGL